MTVPLTTRSSRAADSSSNETRTPCSSKFPTNSTQSSPRVFYIEILTAIALLGLLVALIAPGWLNKL
jgi:hypothetical protein